MIFSDTVAYNSNFCLYRENQRNVSHDDLKSALDELNKAMQE